MLLLQAAKLINAGLAVSAISGAGVGIGTVFGALINTIVIYAILLFFSSYSSTIFVAHCDSLYHQSSIAAHDVMGLTIFFYKIVALFILFTATFLLCRYFYPTSVTDTLASNIIASYFFGFLIYRVCYGLSTPPFLFLLVAFSYFLLAAKKNMYGFWKLYENSNDQKKLFNEMEDFNKGLSNYFLTVSVPLFVNVACVAFNVYVDGVTSGFCVTPSIIFSSLDWLEQVCCFMLALFNGLVYKIISLMWSQGLFNLTDDSFYKLTAGLIFLPLVSLFVILAYGFMNVCAKFYLQALIVYFSVLAKLLLSRRIELSMPRSNRVFDFFKKVTVFYIVIFLICGMLTASLSLLFHNYLKELTVIPSDGFFFITPSMVYSGISSFLCFLPEVTELISAYSVWCLVVPYIFFFLIISVLAFFVVFNYEYGVTSDLSPVNQYYIRFFCLSFSIVLFFGGGWSSDETLTNLMVCGGFFLVKKPLYIHRLPHYKLGGYFATLFLEGLSTPGHMINGAGALIGAAFMHHVGKTGVAHNNRRNALVEEFLLLRQNYISHVKDLLDNVNSEEDARRVAEKIANSPELTRATYQYLKGQWSNKLVHDVDSCKVDLVFRSLVFRSHSFFINEAVENGRVLPCPILGSYYLSTNDFFKKIIQEVHSFNTRQTAVVEALKHPLKTYEGEYLQDTFLGKLFKNNVSQAVQGNLATADAKVKLVADELAAVLAWRASAKNAVKLHNGMISYEKIVHSSNKAVSVWRKRLTAVNAKLKAAEDDCRSAEANLAAIDLKTAQLMADNLSTTAAANAAAVERANAALILKTAKAKVFKITNSANQTAAGHVKSVAKNVDVNAVYKVKTAAASAASEKVNKLALVNKAVDAKTAAASAASEKANKLALANKAVDAKTAVDAAAAAKATVL